MVLFLTIALNMGDIAKSTRHNTVAHNGIPKRLMTALFNEISASAQLAATDISISRGDVELVSGISFILNPGDVLWIQGDNGIGKTTLLETLAGLNRPDAGTLIWSRNKAQYPANQVTAYQAHRDYAKPTLTVTEDLSFWAKLYGNRNDVSAALVYVGLEEKVTLATVKLSAGQRRRLALAKLIVSQRPIWILDEPDAAMDKSGTALIDKLVKSHIGRGGSAIIASHMAARNLSENTRKLTLSTADD